MAAPDVQVSVNWFEDKLTVISTLMERKPAHVSDMKRDRKAFFPGGLLMKDLRRDDHIEFEIKGAVRLTTTVLPPTYPKSFGGTGNRTTLEVEAGLEYYILSPCRRQRRAVWVA